VCRSYSRLLAFEAARILFRLGCDVRVYNPAGLPQKDDVQHAHPKVQELRDLSKWSDGHVWISPEQHGNLVRPLIPRLGNIAPILSSRANTDGNL
jgi:arsenic resistance protein ArsH